MLSIANMPIYSAVANIIGISHIHMIHVYGFWVSHGGGTK